MSIGTSFFNALSDASKLLDSQEFKDLYVIDKYNPKWQDYNKVDKTRAIIFDLRQDLERLLCQYYDLIFDLDNLLKEEDVQKNLRQLEMLNLDIGKFLENVKKIMDKISKAELPSRAKGTLENTFTLSNEAHTALLKYHESCIKIYNAFNLTDTVSLLQADFKKLNVPNHPSKSEKKQKNAAPAYQLHQGQESHKIDIEKFSQDYPQLKAQEEGKQSTYKQKEQKYDKKGIVSGLLCLLIVTLPVAFPLFVYYLHKSTGYNRKKHSHERRLDLLEKVKKDINLVKDTLTELKENPDVSKIDDSFVNQKIQPKLIDLKNAVSGLGKDLEIDLKEKSKHSPTSRYRRH